MKNSYVAETQITIRVPVSKVWEALTKPELIKRYFFGVEVISDWTIGSPIIYRGVWQGKPYEDKGNILDMIPNKLLICNYWSSFSGLPDMHENYQKVIYVLNEEDGQTKLTISQDNIATEEARKKSVKNWEMVLLELKKLLEAP